ncbi:MAG: sortase, partial [Nocardioidaceae bacterium]
AEARAAEARAADARAADARGTSARSQDSRAGDARAVASGEALAVMRIPRFGPDWRWAVSEGVSQKVLAAGPGHYPGTPLPGQRGNSAYAAHRAGHGDPFIDFDRLRPGDRVHISQGDTTWTYRLDRRPRIIPTSASWVLNPLPGHRLTLTTCWPKYGSAKRMYVTGHLVGTTV